MDEFCGCFVLVDGHPKYLPKVQLNIHTTILDNISRTVLSQTFSNPSNDHPIEEAHYTFPLYDGVSVTNFTCTVGGRVISGVVKERQKAKEEFAAAKEKGKTAALFQQSIVVGDIFTTTIGNIPAGGKATVAITYLGELKHDAEIDGVRLTIPTYIAPRYGADALINGGSEVHEEGMSVIVDIEMPREAAIKSVQSPSHPIAVNIGKVSTDTDKSSDISLRKASATLTEGISGLDKDFIISVTATNIGEPCAFVETHPTIPHQRALMVTLVPKFNLPAEKPEIIFICDRSGSMEGKIPNLKTALRIFLKSLPIGVKFNFCSFGSDHDFLWPKSKAYTQQTLDEAELYVGKFDANYGGTEIYPPMKAAFERRHKGMNLAVFLLTDGQIYLQDELFNLISDQVRKSENKVRVFSLGIGSGASTSLIEGVARAGNGFAQSVQDGEKMEIKVVRMLKGSLLPYIHDYKLEVKYDTGDPEDSDGFEIIESIMDSLHIEGEDQNTSDSDPASETKIISLYDCSVKDGEMNDHSGTGHLPTISAPRYLQTPAEIPPLYPFNRTSVYVLLSDSTPNKSIKSIVLSGTSLHGRLNLEIPVVALADRSTTIHQLAAHKEIKELEEGRGWLASTKTKEGNLQRDVYKDTFWGMLECEAVRLGVKFQVAGKWTSFVAVEQSLGWESSQLSDDEGQDDTVEGKAPSFALGRKKKVGAILPRRLSPHSDYKIWAGNLEEDLIDYSDEEEYDEEKFKDPGQRYRESEDVSNATYSRSPRKRRQLFDIEAEVDEEDDLEYDDDDCEDDTPSQSKKMRGSPTGPNSELSNKFQALISIQTFAGSWLWDASLEIVLGLTCEDVLELGIPVDVATHKNKGDILATVCAVVFLAKKYAADKESWEMLVAKADDWLKSQIGNEVENLKKIVEVRF